MKISVRSQIELLKTVSNTYKTSSKRLSKSNVYRIVKNVVKKVASEIRRDIKKIGGKRLTIAVSISNKGEKHIFEYQSVRVLP